MSRNLILTGGPGHDFGAMAATVAEALGAAGVASTVVDRPEVACEMVVGADPDEPAFDLLTVLALHWGMDAERYAHLRDEHAYRLSDACADALLRFVTLGGGLLALHTAVICFDAHPTWRALCGAAWDWERSFHPPAGPATVEPTLAGRSHSVTRGLPAFTVTDEVYADLDLDAAVEPLLTSTHSGTEHPVMWAQHVGLGRAVTSLLGHDAASLGEPSHRMLLERSAQWAMGDLP